jgi:hypothetical protein
MKHMCAARFTAANACPLTLAEIAAHLPRLLGNSVDADDGTHSLIVLNACLRNPNSTHDVCPTAVISGLECTSFLMAQTTNWRRWFRISFLALGARVTQPRARGNFLDAVANLVHSHVATIANNDQIVIIRVVVLTNGAHSFVNGDVLRVGVQTSHTLTIAAAAPSSLRSLQSYHELLFQPIDKNFKNIERHFLAILTRFVVPDSRHTRHAAVRG